MMKRFIFLFPLFLLLAACTKEEPAYLDKYVGSYSIEEIHWTGLPVYLNGDTTGTHDLLDECENCPGFVKSWIKGSVKTISKDELVYTSIIPIYVTDVATGHGEFQYIEAVNKAKWYGIPDNTSIKGESFHPAQSEGFIGATDVRLYYKYITKDSYVLCVSCSLPDDKDNLNIGTMELTFKKD